MPHTDPECQYPPAFINFLIRAFRSPDQCPHRKFRMIEGFWEKKFLKKFITRVVTDNFFFQNESECRRDMIERILMNSLSKIKIEKSIARVSPAKIIFKS